MEDIKDGQPTTSIYDNDNIQFKTPNIVMIFSNTYPDLKKLTNDRWLVLHPNQEGLKDFTDGLRKLKKEKSTEDDDDRYCDAWKFKIDQENDNCIFD